MDLYAPMSRGFYLQIWRMQYPELSPLEFMMIEKFLFRFPIEEEGFNEEDDSRWVAFKQILGGAPDLRNQAVTLLHQIRCTKGYVVDVFVDFSRFPLWSQYGVFTPRDLTNPRFLRLASDAAQAVVDELNRRKNVRPTFTLLGVDKLVTTNKNRLLLTFRASELDVGAEIPSTGVDNRLLLTFSASELDVGAEIPSTVHLRAMVDLIGFSIATDEGFPDTFKLT